MSKIFFPVEITANSDIIYGYLLEDNDDCDKYDVPFKFRVRFLLPTMTNSLGLWSNNKIGGATYNQVTAWGFNAEALDFYLRMVRSSNIWWGHALEHAKIVACDQGCHMELNINQDEPIKTAQRRWIS